MNNDSTNLLSIRFRGLKNETLICFHNPSYQNSSKYAYDRCRSEKF